MGFAPPAAATTPPTAAATLVRINAIRREMKTFLLLAVSSVITAGVLPSLPAKIILSAFVLLAVVSEAVREAPPAIRMRVGFAAGVAKLARLRRFGAFRGQARIKKNI